MELGSADFNGQTLKRQGTMAVLFLASWCSFCTQFRQVFEAAAKSHNTPWAWVDVSDDDSIFWGRFNIDTVPTVVVFKDGKPIFRRDGERGRGLSKDAVNATIEQVRSSTNTK